MIKGSRQVEVDCHLVVAQRVKVGVKDFSQRNIAQACNGSCQDTHSSLNHKLDGRVVQVKSYRLRKRSVAYANSVYNKPEGVLRIELPSRHRNSHVEVVRRRGTADWNLGAVALVEETSAGRDSHARKRQSDVSRCQEWIGGAK